MDKNIKDSKVIQNEEIDYTKFNKDTLWSEEEEDLESTLDESPEMLSHTRKILEQCRVYWDNLQSFRAKRKKVRDYVLGEQWNEKVTNAEGKTVTEEQYIAEQGLVPMVNNQMGQLLRNLVGQYRKTDTNPVVVARERVDQLVTERMTNTLQASLYYNEARELDAAVLREGLISGAAGYKTLFDYIPRINRKEGIVGMFNAAMGGWNTDAQDPRGADIHTIFEIHELPAEEILRLFSKNEKDAKQISEWLGIGRAEAVDYSISQGKDLVDRTDFYVRHDYTKYRVFEVWKQELMQKYIVHDVLKGEYYESYDKNTPEYITQVNNQRILDAALQGVEDVDGVPLIQLEMKTEPTWVYYFLTEQGKVLQHDVTPYDHGEHPYTLDLWPMIDGEIHGLLYEPLDQQRQINRLLTQMDFMISASAKGLLMIPEGSIPEGWTEQDYADEWTKINGVIYYKPNDRGHKPEQLVANSRNPAASELLQIQMQLFKEISGVTEAIQGQRPTAGTPSSLYAQMAEYATYSTADYFEKFESTRNKRNRKLLHLIQQFQTDKIYVNTTGKSMKDNTDYYDPEEVKDIEFDTVIGESNSPVFRQMMEDSLMKFYELGGIGLDMYLEHSSLPFADKLLQSLNKKKEEMQSKSEEQGVNPDELLAQQAQG